MRRKRAGEKVFPFHRLFYAVLGVKNSFYTNQRKRWSNLETQIFSVGRKIAFIKTRIIYENQPLIMLVGCPSRSFCRFWICKSTVAGGLPLSAMQYGRWWCSGAVHQRNAADGRFFSQRPKRRYKACAASALRTAPAHRLARCGSVD